MTTDELMEGAEALFEELRELRRHVIAQGEDTATLYAWLCVMAAKHGTPSPGWHRATEGLELTMTTEERALWLKARASWLGESYMGYLSGTRDISLPKFS